MRVRRGKGCVAAVLPPLQLPFTAWRDIAVYGVSKRTPDMVIAGTISMAETVGRSSAGRRHCALPGPYRE